MTRANALDHPFEIVVGDGFLVLAHGDDGFIHLGQLVGAEQQADRLASLLNGVPTRMTSEHELFGALPELDSMAVASLLTELEDQLDIIIDDDEVDGEMLETFGNLTAFAVAKKLG